MGSAFTSSTVYCAGHRRQQQHIHARPFRIGRALRARPARIDPRTHRRADKRAAPGDDRAHGWVHRLFMLGDESLQRRQALGDPGAFIEQRARVAERREIDLDSSRRPALRKRAMARS